MPVVYTLLWLSVLTAVYVITRDSLRTLNVAGITLLIGGSLLTVAWVGFAPALLPGLVLTLSTSKVLKMRGAQ